MARKEGGDPLEGVKGKEQPLGRTSIPPLTRLPHEIGDWRSEMKIGERASLLYERAAMELTSLVSGMTEFAANLYPLKTEEELVALLSGMHHFPPGVPERARRVHERLPAGSALCSSDVGVLIDRLDTEGGLGGLYKHLAHTKEDLHFVPSTNTEAAEQACRAALSPCTRCPLVTCTCTCTCANPPV